MVLNQSKIQKGGKIYPVFHSTVYMDISINKIIFLKKFSFDQNFNGLNF